MTDDSEINGAPSSTASATAPATDPMTDPNASTTDPRMLPASLAFSFAPMRRGTVAVRYFLDEALINGLLYADGRIEQVDTASKIFQLTSLTMRFDMNGTGFEIDQHAVQSTPSDLCSVLNLPLSHAEGELVLRTVLEKTQGIDNIAMVIFKYFLNTGHLDTSKSQSDTHSGPIRNAYKLSVQVQCLKLAVALNANRFLALIVKEIEYVWLLDDLSGPQLDLILGVAPRLDRFLVLWTFNVPTRKPQDSTSKNRLIEWALVKYAYYRKFVLRHARKYLMEGFLPSVQKYLDTVAQDTRTRVRMAKRKAEEEAQRDAAALAEPGIVPDAHS